MSTLATTSASEVEQAWPSAQIARPVRAGRRVRLPASLLAACVIFGVWLVASVAVPIVVGRSAEEVTYTTKLMPPGTNFLLGTDALGRDVLVRTAVAFRYDLAIGLISVIAACVFGLLIGAMAGSGSEWVDNLTMGVLDVVSVFPGFVLALTMAAAFGPSLTTVIVAITVVLIPGYARGTRAAIMTERSKPYAEAARAMALSHRRIVLVHLLPNCLGAVLTQASMDVASAIMIAAGLSFIGFGVQPPTPEWGLMINEGSSYIVSGEWWVTFFPGLAILSVIFGFFLLDSGVKQLRRA
jgi:peptide/nickel transport system permease protein